MSSKNVPSLADLIGEWRTTQKLLFAFSQFSYFLFGWQSFELVFLIPNVKLSCNDEEFNTTNVTACSSECKTTNYEQDVFKATLTEELSLVCGRSWLQSLTFALLMGTAIVGNLLSGEMADRIGRRKTILVFFLPYLLGSLLVFFPLGYAIFAVGECLIGLSVSSIASLSFILTFEFCGPTRKGTIGVLLNFGYSFGVILLGILAWAIRHWLHLHVITTIFVAAIALIGILPESVDWLIRKGRTDEALKTIRKIILINRKTNLSECEIKNAMQQLSDSYKLEQYDELISFHGVKNTRYSVAPSSRTPLTVLGWGFSSLPYLLIYAYTAELFPTEIRGKAFGVASCMGRLGGAVAPFAKELANNTKDYVPMLIFATLYTILCVFVIKLVYAEKDAKSTKEETEKGAKSTKEEPERAQYDQESKNGNSCNE